MTARRERNRSRERGRIDELTVDGYRSPRRREHAERGVARGRKLEWCLPDVRRLARARVARLQHNAKRHAEREDRREADVDRAKGRFYRFRDVSRRRLRLEPCIAEDPGQNPARRSTHPERDDLFELLGDDGRGSVAIDGELLEEPHDDALQGSRNLGSPCTKRRRGRASDALGRRAAILCVVPFERPRSREQLVEHHAEREQIAPRVRRVAEDLLGGHVRGRPERDRLELHRLARGALSRALCDAEVDELHLASQRHEHVARLHVTVNDAAVVRMLERARDRGADDGRRLR